MRIADEFVVVFWLAETYDFVWSALRLANMGDELYLRFILRNNRLLCLKFKSKHFIIVVSLDASRVGDTIEYIDDHDISKWNNTRMITYLYENMVVEFRYLDADIQQRTTAAVQQAMVVKKAQQRKQLRVKARAAAVAAPTVPAAVLTQERRRSNSVSYAKYMDIEQTWGKLCKHCGADFLQTSGAGLMKKCCQDGEATKESSIYPHLQPLSDCIVLLMQKFGDHIAFNSSSYNNMLSFACTGLANNGEFNRDLVGNSSVKLHGSTYHKMNYARNGSTPSGGTSYFIFDQRVHEAMTHHILYFNQGGRGGAYRKDATKFSEQKDDAYDRDDYYNSIDDIELNMFDDAPTSTLTAIEEENNSAFITTHETVHDVTEVDNVNNHWPTSSSMGEIRMMSIDDDEFFPEVDGHDFVAVDHAGVSSSMSPTASRRHHFVTALAAIPILQYSDNDPFENVFDDDDTENYIKLDNLTIPPARNKTEAKKPFVHEVILEVLYNTLRRINRFSRELHQIGKFVDTNDDEIHQQDKLDILNRQINVMADFNIPLPNFEVAAVADTKATHNKVLRISLKRAKADRYANSRLR